MRIALLTLVTIIHFSCSNENIDVDAFQDDKATTSINGTWKVISFQNYSDHTEVVKTQENSLGLDIVVTFDDSKQPHEFTGTNTTNAFLGQFNYIDERQLDFFNYAATEVAQPAWADLFDQAIAGDAEFRINSDQLRIYYDNKMKSMTLQKQ